MPVARLPTHYAIGMNTYRKFGSILPNNGVFLSSQPLALDVEFDIKGRPLSIFRNECLQNIKSRGKIFWGITKKLISRMVEVN